MIVQMSREFMDQPILKRIREVAGEEALHDYQLYFGSSSTTMRSNRFLLSMFSPVLHRMTCGNFIESNGMQLQLNDVNGAVFGKMLDLWCGIESSSSMELKEVQELAGVADRFQVTEVTAEIDETLMKHLEISTCGDVLSCGGKTGLGQSVEAARRLAAERFEQLANTEGFMRLAEEELDRLLDDDDLTARNEEAVWEAVIKWRAGAGQARGRGVVTKIRFPLMEEWYLRSRVVGMAPAEDAEWMQGVVAEALRAKAAARGDGEGFEFELLGPKALDQRVEAGVRWGRFVDRGGRRLGAHLTSVLAIAECSGRACSGSEDGLILVWNMTGEAMPERTLVPVEVNDSVLSLSVWEGRLISGHRSGKLRVWDVVTGACDQVLDGYTHPVLALAVCGSILASGFNSYIKVWAMGANVQLTWERTLLGHSGCVCSLAEWQGTGKLLSGSVDMSIRVWDMGTGAHDATLIGHDDAVVGLVAHRDRLFSASRDGTIRVWTLGTWEPLRTVEVYGRETGVYPSCLVVSGSQLVSGSASGLRPEVLVWGLETLELQHRLQQSFGTIVWALSSMESGVWAGVGNDVVVWRSGE